MMCQPCAMTITPCVKSVAPRFHDCRKWRGDEFWFGDVLKVLVVDVGANVVKLALSVPDDTQRAVRQLPGKPSSAAIPRIDGPGYFVSSASGCYRYVANARSRTRLRVNGSGEVVIDAIAGLCVELASTLPFQPPLENPGNA